VNPFTGTKATRSPRPWSQFEQQISDTVAQIFASEAARIAGRIKQHGSGTLTDDATWKEYQARLLEELTPLFQGMTQQATNAAARTIAGGVPEMVNWGLVNQHAADWAKQYAGKLISNVTDTTRQGVRDQVGKWIEAKETLPELIKRITDVKGASGGALFGPVRAQMIAITEATNVYAESNANAWQSMGVLPATFKPSGHVRCRCWLTTKKLEDGTRVMVWQTARDDLVCVQDIETPWGTVKGCRELHNTIVSEGDYLGKKWQ
jgi:hypothetical protein